MQLGISSDAFVDAWIEDLIAACIRRGLGALELTLDGNFESDQVRLCADIARGEGVLLSGLLTDASSGERGLAALSQQTKAPVLVRGCGDLNSRMELTRSIIEQGGTALLVVHGPGDSWLEPVMNSNVPFAWQVDDTCPDPASDAKQILQRAGDIPYVRLAGGGPETAMQEDRGVGTLMSLLALAGYAGPLILTPTSRRYRIAWSAWLGRRGGWGCGSKADRTQAIPLQL